MSTSFRSIRDFLLLFLWGSFVLWMTLTRQLSTYLHPSLQPYTAAAGVILIILALFLLRAILKGKNGGEGCGHDHEHSCCHGHDHEEYAAHEENEHSHGEHDHEDHKAHEQCHGHDHAHEEEPHQHDSSPQAETSHDHHHHEQNGGLFSLSFKTLLLLLPLAIVVLGQNNHYTMSTITNRGVVQDLSRLPSAKSSARFAAPAATPAEPTSNQQSDTETPTAATASGAMPIQVIDLLYAVQMPTYREEFQGKQVELIGQFVPLTVGNPKGDRFQAIRLFITCCAADAKPVGVTVQYDKPLKVSEMGWVKITGTPTFPMEGGRRTAILVANKVEECAAPDEPFVY